MLGHTASNPATLADSRARELAADKWAVEHLLKADILPIAGTYALILYYFQD